jgi:hypothetical protein
MTEEQLGWLPFARSLLKEAGEMGWVKTSDRRPEAGRLIVKRWKNGSVWAGVYSGTDKDSSFDEWCYLPNN